MSDSVHRVSAAEMTTSLSDNNWTTSESSSSSSAATCGGRFHCFLEILQHLLAADRNQTAPSLDDGPPPKNWHTLVLLLVVVAGVTGNLLVCIAVSVEKKLRNITNYFLVSLAIADLFVSLVVMPCSIVQEFLGYWPFDLVMCDVWQVLDVTMCTSSIMHMCTISMDRYVGIRHPLRTRVKTCTSAGLKMVAVWCISLAIASPIVLLSVFKPQDVLTDDGYPLCSVFNSYFLSYGSLTAFFVPLLIMLVAYSLTIQLLSRQCRLSRAAAANEGIRRSLNRSVSAKSAASHHSPKCYCRRLEVGGTWTANGSTCRRQTHPNNNTISDCETEPLRRNASQESDTESSRTRRRVVNPLSLLGVNPLQALNGNSKNNKRNGSNHRLHDAVKQHSALIRAGGGTLQPKQDTWLRRASTVRTEQKAVKVLGTMFALFVICWLPFFSLNFAMGVCETCKDSIEPLIFKVCLWLGYVSSTLNPIIYTVFNRNFRRTFARLISCTYKGSRRRRAQHQMAPLISTPCNRSPTQMKQEKELFDTLNESNV